MSEWTRIKPQDQTVVLDECPFCHSGETFFLQNPDFQFLTITHLPANGVVCPARFEQHCDDQKQGSRWWNDRSKKGDQA